MNKLKWHILHIFSYGWQRCLSLLMLVSCMLFMSMPQALAAINDDTYEGNIFVVYAGNGSLVPAQFTLKQTLAVNKPAILVFYVDDSSDCKKFALIVNQVQAYYGRAAEIIPVDVDAISPETKYSSLEPGYYYTGGVPQVVIFNQSGDMVFNDKGDIAFEKIDDKLREVFNLLPRDESVELKRRSFNELNSELTE